MESEKLEDFDLEKMGKIEKNKWFTLLDEKLNSLNIINPLTGEVVDENGTVTKLDSWEKDDCAKLFKSVHDEWIKDFKKEDYLLSK